MNKITQRVVIEAMDWGPVVSKTILHFDRLVSQEYASMIKESMKMIERKDAFDWATFSKLGKEAAKEHVIVESSLVAKLSYTCDENGNKVEGDSEYVAIDIEFDPVTSSPFCFDMRTFFNTFCHPYQLIIHTKDKLDIDPNINLKEAYVPSMKNVDTSGSYIGKDGKQLHFASFEPENKLDGRKHPLMIWLHGAGEGGIDPAVAVLGNKVTALFQEEFQSIMDGAFVFVPQTDYFWLSYNEKGETSNNPGVDSVYLNTLLELIHEYIEAHPEIDRNRIYLSGCSNGGFMTMCLLLNEPDLFAAAVPICEAYNDQGIDDKRLMGMKDVPTWFVYAKNDDLVDPLVYEEPTMERLKELKAEVHASVYEGVFDLTGLYRTKEGMPYEYSGHWSWIYFFNNACREGDLTIWQWLASKHK